MNDKKEKKKLAEKHSGFTAALIYLWRHKTRRLKCLIHGHNWAYNKWLEDTDQSEYLCTRCFSKDKV